MFFNLTQTRITLEVETSTKNYSHLPEAMSVEHFLVIIDDEEEPRPLWAMGLGCIRKKTEQAVERKHQVPPFNSFPWLSALTSCPDFPQ